MKTQRKKSRVLYLLLPIEIWVVSILVMMQLFMLRMLPINFLLYIVSIICMISFLLTIYTNKNIIKLLSVIYIVLGTCGTYYLFKTNLALDKMVEVVKQYHYVNAYVLNNSDNESIADIADKKIGYVIDSDYDYTKDAIDIIQNELKLNVSTHHFESIDVLVDSVKQGDTDVALINPAFVGIYDDNNEGFISNNCRIIYEAKIEEKNQLTKLDANKFITTEPFVIYLSGSDTRSAYLGSNDRSDVNILAVVNPKSKDVLLVTTPRDYYIPLSVSGGSPDKLTHAGVQGIQCSMDTLANLYDIDEVRYYAKINFVGFENIVDALGGVDVWSDYEYTSQNGLDSNENGYYFTYGTQHMNGPKALAFVRERYAFADGDFQRGRNQTYVLKGILNKLKSPAILTGYTGLLDAVSGCFDTNMPRKDIEALVQMQLKDGAEWTINQVSAGGSTGPAYCWSGGAYPLSVVFPDEESVNTIKAQIKSVMLGQFVENADLAEQQAAQQQAEQETQEAEQHKMAIFDLAEKGLMGLTGLMALLTLVLTIKRFSKKKK